MNYVRALEISTKPYYTLQEAFVAVTDEAISARQMQRLLKTYDKFDILKGIEALAGREVDKPYPYLLGILKRMRNERFGIQERNGRNLVKEAVATIKEEQTRKDRPELRSPFNETTA